MPFSSEWLVEGSLCYVTLSGQLTAEDMRQYDDQVCRYLETAPEKMHFIADLRHLTSLPPLGSMVGLKHLSHPRLGRGLTVGLTSNPVGRFLVSMGAQIVGVKQKDFNTLEEARSYLHQMEGI
jgi:hypothetical protein